MKDSTALSLRTSRWISGVPHAVVAMALSVAVMVVMGGPAMALPKQDAPPPPKVTVAASLKLLDKPSVGQLVRVKAAAAVTIVTPGEGVEQQPVQSFTWALTGRPPGSTAALTGTSTLTASLTPDRTGSYTVTFTASAPPYGRAMKSLTFTVGTPTSKQDRAYAALADFQQSSRPGKFTAIAKATLIAEIKARIAKPTVMYQGQENLCGPVAVLVALADQNPERYVQMTRSMYEGGQFAATPDYVVKPDSHLYSQSVPASMANANANVDWMLAASMRDFENVVFDMDPGDKVAAATWPGEVRKWFEKLLLCPSASYDSCYVYGEKKALQKAANALAGGSVVALMIDANFLPGGNPSGWDQATNSPNHWVLLRHVDSANAPYKFTIYTWGREMLITGIDDGRLEDLLWGVVIGYDH